jgi:hypothetical protein
MARDRRTVIIVSERVKGNSWIDNILCSQECRKDFLSAFAYGKANLSTVEDKLYEDTYCDKCHKELRP